MRPRRWRPARIPQRLLTHAARARWDVLTDAAPADIDERLCAKLAKQRKLSWRGERRRLRPILRSVAHANANAGACACAQARA